MSSFFRLRSRAMSSFSAAFSSPVSTTVRSYSGPNCCLSRSDLLRRLVDVPTMTATTATASTAITIHIQTGISSYLLVVLMAYPYGFDANVN